MTSVPLKWISNTVYRLDTLGGYGSVNDACAATGILVGVSSNGVNALAVQWNGTSVSQLDDVSPGQDSFALNISLDGATITGNSNLVGTIWTSGGAVGSLATIAAGTVRFVGGNRAMSDTASIIIANVYMDADPLVPNAATSNHAGATTLLTQLAIPGFENFTGSEVRCCSSDGLTVVGFTATDGSPVPRHYATYWRAGNARKLRYKDGDSAWNADALFCTADGSVVFGTTFLFALEPNILNVYWTDINTSHTDGFGDVTYGTIHTMDFLPLTPAATTYPANMQAAADELSGGDPIAVGYYAADNGTDYPVKWTGTAVADLGPLAAVSGTRAYDVTADSSVVVGNSMDLGGIEWPVYWDGTGIHKLPTIADVGDTFQGVAVGVTPDGAIIWGLGDAPTVPGVPEPFCGVHHTTSSFTAAWSAIDAATSYTVDYRKLGDVSFTEVTGITDAFLVIAGLDPATPYEFKVKAINDDGESDFSELVTCTTIGRVMFLICDANWTITQPQTKVYGLDHLAGQTVTGLVDGIALDPVIVGLDGSVDLPFPASFITLGLGFPVQVQTPYLDTGNPTVQGRRKDIVAVTVRVDSSATPDVGSNQLDGGAQVPTTVDPPWVDMFPAVTTNPELLPVSYVGPSGQTTTKLFSGDFRANVQAGWDERGQTAVQQTLPLPLSITAVVPEVVEGDSSEQGYAQKNQGQQQGQRGPGPWMLRN